MAYRSKSTIVSLGRALAVALLLGTAVLTFTPAGTAFAARNIPPTAEAGDAGESDGGGSSVTTSRQQGIPRGFLESKGYTCKFDSQIGMHRCTKPGAPGYVCDGGGTCVMDVYGPPMPQDIVYHGTGTRVQVEP